jgi:hypothetical protein
MRSRLKAKPGLDELMIVNPAPAPARNGRKAILSGDFFLGSDGVVYYMEGADPAEVTPPLGRYFLGEDGTVYRFVSEREKRTKSRQATECQCSQDRI